MFWSSCQVCSLAFSDVILKYFERFKNTHAGNDGICGRDCRDNVASHFCGKVSSSSCVETYA